MYVPERVSQAKLELLARLGADLRHVGADVDEAKDAARAPRASATGCRSSRTAPSRLSSRATRRSAARSSSSWGAAGADGRCRSATARC